MRKIEIDPGQAGRGLMALLVALAEVLHEVMCHQALRRIESGRLTDEETERVGMALLELEAALENLKREQGLDAPVEDSHRQLSSLLHTILGRPAEQSG